MRTRSIALVAALCGLLIAAAAPGAAQSDADDSLAFLGDLNGMYPDDVHLYEVPGWKTRMTALLGEEVGLVAERLQIGTPITVEGSVAYLHGTRRDAGPADAALIVVDLERDELWVWLTVGGELRRFGPDGDPDTVPADAAEALQRMQSV